MFAIWLVCGKKDQNRQPERSGAWEASRRPQNSESTVFLIGAEIVKINFSSFLVEAAGAFLGRFRWFEAI